MTLQKIRRTSGNLARFEIEHQIRVEQTVDRLEQGYYLLTTTARVWADGAALIVVNHRVSRSPTGIDGDLSIWRQLAITELAGKFNLMLDMQREQEALDAAKEREAQS